MSIFFLLFLTTAFARTCNPLPLSTNGRWIIEESTGNRVKLTCVNWAGHLEPMIIEGLQKQSLSYVTDKIISMGFNCVRLTWSTYMFTRQNYTSLTVGQSLDLLGLKDAKSGVAENNPEFLNVTVVDVQKAVVNRLSGKGIMVVLDNHVSKPEWCCGEKDGNGFFGDAFFDPEEWIQGLSLVAKLYKANTNVVGISLRNELRGPLQNQDDWYRYMEEGENAIHKENPSILVIISGLSYETDLSFLKQKSLNVMTNKKLVYEAHWYSFFSPSEEKWTSDTNALCANQTRKFLDNTGFLIDSASGGSNFFPLFLSEFGVNQSGEHEIDNRYLSCLIALLGEYDLDWGLWALQGSYMIRQGNQDTEEVFGMLDFQWKDVRNSSIQQRLNLVKQISQDFRSDDPTEYILYHPQSGECIQIANDDGDNHLYTTDCRRKNLTRWDHDNNKGGSSSIFIRVKGTTSSSSSAGECLSAVGDGSAAVVSSDCSSGRASSWEMISSTKMHIAYRDDNGEGKYLCLERNSSSSKVLTRKCLCLDDSANDVSNCSQNPQTQWFKFVPTNVIW